MGCNSSNQVGSAPADYSEEVWQLLGGDELEAQACAAVTADRQAFVAALEAGTKATEEFCERAAAEEALKQLRRQGESFSEARV